MLPQAHSDSASQLPSPPPCLADTDSDSSTMNSNNLVGMMLMPNTTAAEQSSVKRVLGREDDCSKHRSKKRHRRNISGEEDEQPRDVVVQVPRDYATLGDAIAFANDEFQRSAALKESNKTVTILIDPSFGTIEMETCLEVRAVGEGAQLVLASLGQEQATIVLETKTPNQPLLKLVQGRVELKNLSLEHSSTVDLITLVTRANNNAAVVVNRPSKGKDEAASVSLKNVVLRSYTGKGIINHNSSCKVTQDDLRIFNPLY